MKSLKLLTLMLGMFLFVSCNTDRSGTSTATGTETGGSTTTVALTGNFVSKAHTTTGTANVLTGKTQLNFENFKTDNGPKLNIYLASNIDKVAADYVDLGAIKGVSGNYSYTFPSGVDFSKYKYVVVWCVDFNVAFGYAEVK